MISAKFRIGAGTVTLYNQEKLSSEEIKAALKEKEETDRSFDNVDICKYTEEFNIKLKILEEIEQDSFEQRVAAFESREGE